MKLLHISDTHFHHSDSVNADIYKRIEALKAYPDHWKIITGDITDDGRGNQYNRATDCFLTVGKVIVLPGNHDYGAFGSIYTEEDAKAFDIFAGWFSQRPFFEKIPSTFQIDNVLFILLNSCLKTDDPFDFACGEVGREQLQLLTIILDDPSNKDLVKVVALHHHPFIHSDPTMKLLDADRLARTIYGKADLLLFGHKHESAKWENKVGCRYILAADALFESSMCREIIIEGSTIIIQNIRLF